MSGAREPAPFFILGAPRTGTTLLRRFLTAHSRLAIPTESGFMVDYLEATDVSLALKKRLLSVEPEIDYWRIDLSVAELAPLESIGACFAHAHQRYAEARGKDLWGNKTPKLVRATDLLMTHFPGCRFLHTVRDGRAVAASLRKSRAHRLHPLHGASRYAKDTALGLALEREHPERVLRVRYEDLVTDLEPVIRKVCDFLAIDFEASMLDPDQELLLTPAEREAGHHRNVSKPVDAAFVEKWKSELTAAEVALVEHVAGEVIAEAGYEVGEPMEPDASLLREARLHHLRLTVRKAIAELRDRPDVWRIARRRLQLGSLRRMLGDHVRGL